MHKIYLIVVYYTLDYKLLVLLCFIVCIVNNVNSLRIVNNRQQTLSKTRLNVASIYNTPYVFKTPGTAAGASTGAVCQCP